MSISAEPIIYAMIFVAVLVVVEGIYLTVFGRSISLNNRVNRRLEMLDKTGNREEVMEKLRKEMEQHLKARKIPLYSILSTKAQKAAIAFTPKQLIMLMVACGVLAFIGLSVGTSTAVPVRIFVSAVMGVGGIFVWINMKAGKRMAMLEEQLPDAIELMVRSLRGSPVFLGHLDRGQRNFRPAGDGIRRHRGRGRLRPRHGRGAQGSGRTPGHAGFAFPCRGGDDPAAIGW